MLKPVSCEGALVRLAEHCCQLSQEADVPVCVEPVGVLSSCYSTSAVDWSLTTCYHSLGSCGSRNPVDGTGSFKSPGFPGLYLANLDCRWEIGGELHIQVVATISYLELEKFYDHLWVYDGCCGDNSKLIGNMTGKSLNSDLFIGRTQPKGLSTYHLFPFVS